MDWERLEGRFEEHFGTTGDEEDELVYSSASSRFSISRSGKVEAEMPLHNFSAESFEQIEFLDNRIEVRSGDTFYEFRK
ncbi:MAG: hypothetical protein ABEJ07_06375 [Candidatus Nanohaloarchaea archaeon]